jgi:hypothetical protein
MSVEYISKDRAELTFEANKKRLRTEASILLSWALNEALAEMSEQFLKALHDGELLEITTTPAEMMPFFQRAIEKHKS